MRQGLESGETVEKDTISSVCVSSHGTMTLLIDDSEFIGGISYIFLNLISLHHHLQAHPLPSLHSPTAAYLHRSL